MSKEQIKAMVRNNLQNKRIVLFGAGKVAKDFYVRNKTEMNISHCVSNIRSEWKEKGLFGEVDVREFKQEEIDKDDYIIVCGAYAFRQIEPQLMSCGFKIFEHYIEASMAECLKEDKKVVLFRGSCILRDIYESILMSKVFTEQYTSIFTNDNSVTSKYDDRVLFYMSKICDVYIYSYRIMRQDKVYLFNDELSEDCQVISVSNISFHGCWPQLDLDIHKINKYFIHSYNTNRDLTFYHTMYRLEDLNLNRLIEEGKSADEIYNIVSAVDYYDENQVKRNLRMGLRTVMIAEGFADIKVLDFIEENYKKRKLYQNTVHMHKCVVWTYVRRLFEKLNLSCDECDGLEERATDYVHHGGDIPIYPSVARALELEWINEETKYEIMTCHGVEYMDFEEYVRHYVEYTQKAKRIMELW